jgi:hypothetical protein
MNIIFGYISLQSFFFYITLNIRYAIGLHLTAVTQDVAQVLTLSVTYGCLHLHHRKITFSTLKVLTIIQTPGNLRNSKIYYVNIECLIDGFWRDL